MNNRKKKTAPDSRHEEILFGFNSVFEAIKAGRRIIEEVLVSKDRAGERLEGLIGETGFSSIRTRKISPEQMAQITRSEMHQGIAARVTPYQSYDFDDLDDLVQSGGPRLYLILDSMEDPHNFGALCRTALAVGVDAVIIPKDRATGATPAVSRASAGALEHIRVVVVTNLVNAIKALKDRGVWISGLDGAGDRTIFETDFTGATGIVVGGEDSGLRELVRKNCDYLVSIPQAGPVNSLNASVAGAVTLYEVYRQRMTMGK